MPITLHHLNFSRSHRILWLLEEVKADYNIKFYQRNQDYLAPKELKDVHPLGKSPVITDGDSTIAESGAIIEYLVGNYGPHLKPTQKEANLKYTFWLHYAEGSLMQPLLLRLIFDNIVKAVPFIIRPVAKGIDSAITKKLIAPELEKHFAFIENHLSQNEFFAGSEFSASDIQMNFPICAAMDRCGEYIGESTKKWLKKMEERPAYRIAIEKGGPVQPKEKL
ncbi:glutathione S-transferase [Globomyces pollinis-pini]|nr:glutathione S-transferase [Globomyces pollinis-pini]